MLNRYKYLYFIKSIELFKYYINRISEFIIITKKYTNKIELICNEVKYSL